MLNHNVDLCPTRIQCILYKSTSDHLNTLYRPISYRVLYMYMYAFLFYDIVMLMCIFPPGFTFGHELEWIFFKTTCYMQLQMTHKG